MHYIYKQVNKGISATASTNILLVYENIDQTLLNKLHGPMYYKIGVTRVYNGHVFYTLL